MTHNMPFLSKPISIQMDLSLQQTSLEQLKNQISLQKSIEPKYQRLFHLGRELKNCRRTLKALGIGNYNSFVIHLQSSQPKDHVFSSACAKLKSSTAISVSATTSSSSNSSSSNSTTNSNSHLNKRKRRRNESLAMTSTTIAANSIQHPNNRNNNANEKMVVNLLDSDDDDDDDEIEVVEVKRTMEHNHTR